MTLRPAGSALELSWPAAITNFQHGPVWPEFEVQFSTDLQHWQPIGGKVRGLNDLCGARLSLSLERQQGPLFYRVTADPGAPAADETGGGGAQVFGYDSEFGARLEQLGLLSVEDFATNGPGTVYLSQLSWDPTTAQFWTNFSSSNSWYDSVANMWSVPYNFLLDSNEFAIFATNGFVVSERLGSPSFGDAYYKVFNADLPVFVSADSVLHAWHRSYQTMLSELEELQLATLLEQVLSNMSAQLPQTWQQYGRGPLSNSIVDADYFLTVARSLWANQRVSSALADPGVNQQVAGTLSAIYSHALIDRFGIFGSVRGMDFSQFIVRGHYTESERLGRYFQTMMWCGRTDLRLATFAPNKEDDIRQLGTAIVMYHLLEQAGQFQNWSEIEQITRAFVGPTDSMTFAQLGDLLTGAHIFSPAAVPDLATLTNLQTRLLTGELGVQNIHSDFIYSPFSPAQVKVARSFTICGQKFLLDSWAFNQVVFDRVLWTPDYGTNILFGKVIRRKPSCLDMAYAVLGNDQTVPELVARMTDPNGVAFRDGPHLPYQHNLLATRQVIDQQEPAIWTNNIYTAWLAALRSLSTPTTNGLYPESMRTRPWAMKTLNTQLGSWAELRHDTVLYGKQSYTEPILCGYPSGFVEPRPEFWGKMGELANAAGAAIANLRLQENVTVPGRPNQYGGAGDPLTLNLGVVQSQQVTFLKSFSACMSTLQTIATKEQAQEPLTLEEADFLRNIVEVTVFYTNYRKWNGWYPQLFYRNVFFRQTDQQPCDIWDALVTDVHTDLPDMVVGDPGAVIHEGVADVNMLLIAVDNGPDRMVYAGPVLSHYEFEVPGVSRLTDDDWKAKVQAGQKPPAPAWTSSFLVPGTMTVPRIQ